MQSSPPHSDGKARAIRELSRSLSHSPRSIPSISPAPSDSNPTKNSGFGTDFSNWDNDVIMSTQHRIEDETNTLPQYYPGIRSTAKKINSWSGLRSEPPNPDTSMVNKEFGDFDHSVSDEEDISLEQARGGNRSNRSTPAKLSSHAFNSLYNMTPPSKRKSFVAETGSLRRDAQIRRASRNDFENASPRPANTRKAPTTSANDRRRTSLAQLHAKVSEDESSFMEERPATVTLNSTKNTRWGNPRSRQTSLQTDGMVDASPRVNVTPRSRPMTAQNATAQSFILPDLPNLTELVSGVFEDGTPVFSKNAPPRSRFAAPGRSGGAGGRQPSHHPIENLPIPEEEKAIFAALQLLQDKVAQMEQERADANKKIEEQELELIELRATTQAQEKLRRSDSADGDSSGKGSWKVEKTRLDATVQTLRTKLDRADRKVAVLEIEKKRLNSERDNMAGQLGVGFQNFEDVKNEREALRVEKETLRQEVDSLRAENEELRYQLEQEQDHHLGETAQLRRQLDQADNVTQRENITLQAELARVRAQNDDHTQQLARKDIELKKARQEQAEYARLKQDNEALQSKLAGLKAKREEELRRWSNQEASLKAKVDRRDETIRHFQDMTQEQTNEAVRLDNDNLRRELEQLAVQHQEEIQRWSRKEADLKRKIQQRENAARQTMDMTREVLNIRQANGQHVNGSATASADKENGHDETLQRKPSNRREDTRTRIRNRVQQEVRNSRPTGQADEAPRKSYTGISKYSHRASQPVDVSRSASAPVQTGQYAHVESEVESTTDLSLAPRGTPYTTRHTGTFKPSVTPLQPPTDLDLTELSFIDSNQIAQLRRTLEEERAAARRRTSSNSAEQQAREDTVRSERQAREDTVRSVASAKSTRQVILPRKSSLKDVTQRTNITHFEEDLTGNGSILDGAEGDATHTKQSAIDASMLSNTGRRRRSAPTEMTSAFIVPDIKIDARKQHTIKIDALQRISVKGHDNANCTVCRREGITGSSDNLKVPKLVPVSSRMPDDVDATLRPARSPKEALALVVKELQDERAHLHMELSVTRAMLESHDVSLGNRRRKEINESIQELLRRIEIKDTQIYNLYDVLEGQQDHDITEQDVENLTQQVREEEEKAEKKEKAKKVTIQSFVDEDGEPSAKLNAGFEDDEEEALPWEGFDDTNQSMSLVTLEGWRTGVY